MSASSLHRAALLTKPREEFRPPPIEKTRGSQSAPCSPVEPLFTPPRRRRVKSAEASPTWLDFAFEVDVAENDEGIREVHCHVHWWGRDVHMYIQLRHLFFWALMLMFILPTSAFQISPRMPLSVARAPSSAAAVLAVPQRVHLLENITALEPHIGSSILGGAAEDAFAIESLAGEDMELSEEFGLDQCLLDASSDDDLNACLQQIHLSSLDELSGLIVKEGCEVLQGSDDGTVVGLIANILHTAKNEGMPSMDALRKLAVRTCVSAGLHKVTVCVLPALTCMVHAAAASAPNALHALAATVH